MSALIRSIIGMSLQGVTIGGGAFVAWKIRGRLDRIEERLPPAGWWQRVSERLRNLGQGNGI